MKYYDGFGNEITIHSSVVTACNNTLRKGIVVNYFEKAGKWYLGIMGLEDVYKVEGKPMYNDAFAVGPEKILIGVEFPGTCKIC